MGSGDVEEDLVEGGGVLEEEEGVVLVGVVLEGWEGEEVGPDELADAGRDAFVEAFEEQGKVVGGRVLEHGAPFLGADVEEFEGGGGVGVHI